MKSFFALPFVVVLAAIGATTTFAQGPVSQNQGGEVTVTVTGKGIEIPDVVYDFQTPNQIYLATVSGVLHASEGVGIREVTKYVPEQRVKTEAYQVRTIVNGHVVVETKTREVFYTVQKPVTYTVEVVFPEFGGTWTGPAWGNFSLWYVSSIRSSGVLTGFGTNFNGNVSGSLFFLNLSSDNPLPSGSYSVKTQEAALAP